MLQRQRQESTAVNADYSTICDHILTAKRQRQTLSTQKPALSESNFMQDVTNACQEIMDFLVEHKANYFGGEVCACAFVAQAYNTCALRVEEEAEVLGIWHARESLRTIGPHNIATVNNCRPRQMKFSNMPKMPLKYTYIQNKSG